MRNIVIIGTVVLAVGIAAFFLSKYLKLNHAGLRVNSMPAASIYVDGAFIGKTPYTGVVASGQINLKLIPDPSEVELFPYETKINLVAGFETVVDREFGISEAVSSGNIISFDKVGGKAAGLVVISNPDSAQVTIDGAAVGNTPYSFDSITTGSHRITVKTDGYAERVMNLKTIEGLRLTIFAKLAKYEETVDLPIVLEEASDLPKRYVVIGDTSTGFLRMRTEPGTGGEEIAELKPGEKYLYLETDEGTGWYKIRYKEAAPGLPNGIVGWVSSQYSSITTDSETFKQ